MFPYIMGNPILVRTSQNTWKHHITRLAKTDTKLATLLSKLHGLNKGGLGLFCKWIKCTKTFSWCFKGSSSSALTKTYTICQFNASFNTFVLDIVMGLFGTCNDQFTGWSISSLLSSKGINLELKLISNK